MKNHYFKVFVGIPYSAMLMYQPDNIKESIHELSKYVLAPNEKILNIIYYDPSN